MWPLSVLASAIYIFVIFYIRRWMKDKEPFKLKKLLAIWSTSLAVFSIIGTICISRDFVSHVYSKGLTHSICSKGYNEMFATWLVLFTWSKLFELCDTVFIVLRKQPLIVLHWYHHASTMIYCYWGSGLIIGTHVWMMTLNLAIHSVMYSYYALRAMNVHVPKGIAMCITVAQITQMILGMFLNLYFCIHCPNLTDSQITRSVTALLIYLSYFVLFTNFFIHAYVLKPKGKNKQV